MSEKGNKKEKGLLKGLFKSKKKEENLAPVINNESTNTEETLIVDVNNQATTNTSSTTPAATQAVVSNDNTKKDVEELDAIPQVPVKESFFDKVKKLLNSDIGGSGGGKKGLSEKQKAKIEIQKQKLSQELSDPNAKRFEKAVPFVYKAVGKNGKIISSRLFGFSKMDVNSFLLNEGYEPFSIENNSMINFFYGDSAFSSSRMKNKDLVFWLTQLTTYIKAGIPLADSMRILMNQAGKDKKKRSIYESIVYELTMGTAFSDAIAKQGNTFPPLLINMLKAAEATGELEETLTDMVDYYTDVETTRKEMISAMTYPVIVMLFAFGVIFFILIYVVPQFNEIYISMEVTVSGLTATLLKVSDFLKNSFLLVVLIIVAIIVTLVMLYKNVVSIRRAFQVFFMKVPVFGKIIIYNEMVIFSKTFSSLLKNNVNITESVGILSKITTNEIYKEIMVKTIDNIAVGDKISDAFQDQWAVPDVAYHMIVTGESTGQLAEMMEKVAAFYQEQHHSLIASLKSLIEPIMIASLAVIVGVILISVIVPMFDMYDKISMG